MAYETLKTVAGLGAAALGLGLVAITITQVGKEQSADEIVATLRSRHRANPVDEGPLVTPETARVGSPVAGGSFRIVKVSPNRAQVTISLQGGLDLGYKLRKPLTYRWDGTGYIRQGRHLRHAV
jgi:hypothetical protein